MQNWEFEKCSGMEIEYKLGPDNFAFTVALIGETGTRRAR